MHLKIFYDFNRFNLLVIEISMSKMYYSTYELTIFESELTSSNNNCTRTSDLVAIFYGSFNISNETFFCSTLGVELNMS